MHRRSNVKLVPLSVVPWLLLFLLIGMDGLEQRLTVVHPLTRGLLQLAGSALSLLTAAAPWLLLGCVVSALVQCYLSDGALRQMLPRSDVLSLLWASFLGLAFPVGSKDAPIMAERLLRQGASAGTATAFLLAAPVVNPIAIAATYHAFGNSVGVTALRLGCAWLLAICTGDIIGRLHPEINSRRPGGFYQQAPAWRSHLGRRLDQQASWQDLLQQICDRIYERGSLTITAGIVVAAWQTLLPAALQQAVGQLTFLTIPLFMLLSFVLSLTAETDAFLTSAFLGRFAGSSLLAWMLLGPVLNRVNWAWLLRRFEQRFLQQLLTMVSVAVLVLAVLANILGIGALPAEVSGELIVVSSPVIHSHPAVSGTQSMPGLPAGNILIDSNNFAAMMDALWSAGDEIVGRQVEMLGFVYSDPTLGQEDFVLARRMIIEQPEDTVVAGILCRWPDRHDLRDGQWVQVQGKLERVKFYDLHAQRVNSMPIIVAEQLTVVQPPEPEYVYP